MWSLNDDDKPRQEPPPPYTSVTTFGKGKEDDNHPGHKIGVWIAALFVLGEMAGGGVIQMPYAMMQAGMK